MPNYVTEMSRTVYGASGAMGLWRSGPVVLGSVSALTAVNAPSQTAQGDAFDETTTSGGLRGGDAMQCNGTTQYLYTAAADVTTLLAQSGGWGISFMARRNSSGASSDYEQNGGWVNATYNNMIALNFNQRTSGSRSDNHISARLRGPAGAETWVEFLTSGNQFDGQWHQFGLAVDASNLYLIYDGNIVASTALVANSLPTTAQAFALGAGRNSSGAGEFFAPWTYQYLAFTKCLTQPMTYQMGARYNGRTGAKVYYGNRFTRLARKATTKRVPIAQFGDSNLDRSTTDPVGPGAEQGFAITIDRMVRAATGRRLVARHGAASSPYNSAFIDGIYANMTGNVGNTPNNSADTWPVHLYTYDLSEYNRRGPGYNLGFGSDVAYIASGSVSATTAVGFFADPTNADWPLDDAGNLSVKIRYATFNSGSGNFTLTTKKVTGNVTIEAQTQTNTNTGANTFSTDTEMSFGTNVSTAYGQVRIYLGAATGPVAVGPITAINGSRSWGFSLGSLWKYGGQPTSKIITSILSLDTTAAGESAVDTATRFANVISTWLSHLASAGTACIHINEIQNDLNDTGSSYNFTAPYTFTADATKPGNKRAGCKQNMKALVDYFRAIWVNKLGYSANNLYFLFGPYHEIANPASVVGDASLIVYRMENQLQRAVMEICDEDTTYNTCFIIDGPECVPYATMNAASGYDGSGPAHMTIAGYRLLGTEAGAAAAAWVNPPFGSRTRDFRSRSWR